VREGRHIAPLHSPNSALPPAPTTDRDISPRDPEAFDRLATKVREQMLHHSTSNLILVAVGLGEVIGVLLLRGLGEHGGGPHLGGEEGVSLGEGVVNSHCQVTTSAGVSSGRRVHILDTSHVQQLLGDHRGDDTRPTGGRDETHAD
jgi:hypothetical protein